MKARLLILAVWLLSLIPACGVRVGNTNGNAADVVDFFLGPVNQQFKSLSLPVKYLSVRYESGADRVLEIGKSLRVSGATERAVLLSGDVPRLAGDRIVEASISLDLASSDAYAEDWSGKKNALDAARSDEVISVRVSEEQSSTGDGVILVADFARTEASAGNLVLLWEAKALSADSSYAISGKAPADAATACLAEKGDAGPVDCFRTVPVEQGAFVFRFVPEGKYTVFHQDDAGIILSQADYEVGPGSAADVEYETPVPEGEDTDPGQDEVSEEEMGLIEDEFDRGLMLLQKKSRFLDQPCAYLDGTPEPDIAILSARQADVLVAAEGFTVVWSSEAQDACLVEDPERDNHYIASHARCRSVKYFIAAKMMFQRIIRRLEIKSNDEDAWALAESARQVKKAGCE